MEKIEHIFYTIGKSVSGIFGGGDSHGSEHRSESHIHEGHPYKIIAALVTLPLLVGGIYYYSVVYTSRANTSDIVASGCRAKRTSDVSAIIQCTTDVATTLQGQCSVVGNDVPFYVGQSDGPTTSHTIDTRNTGVNLNPGTSYTCSIQVTGSEVASIIIPGEVDGGVGTLDFSSFSSDDVVGICKGELGYDEKYDLDENGCINLHDTAFLEDFE